MARVSLITLLVVGVALGLAGCGAKNESGESQPSASAPATTPPPAATDTAAAPAAMSKFDEGARAGEAAVNGGLASKGERLFTSKGCPVCHGFGKKITCPDLVGVSMRRTAMWMENQILHPEVMVKEDPITMELRKSYALPMTNQKVAPDEARAIIEFLKQKDSKAGVKGVKG
jgi:cytochrome c551/c552